MEENLVNQPEPGLLDDLNAYIQYVRASMGQRFLNFLIDNVLMQYGLSFLTGGIVGFFLASLFPKFAYELFTGDNQFNLFILGYLISIFNYLVYYTFCEKVFNGYTLGKLVTGTKAIRNDGQPLTFMDAFRRSLSRLVPFEAFSALGGYPWHDRWTDTQVIKSR
jgi:uncharacterized RDD family membrane protein YckC